MTVDVADEKAARLWAGKIAVACGWPQEVRRYAAVHLAAGIVHGT